MASQILESFLSGRWSRGEGVETTLVDPVTGEPLATASARGLDLTQALAFARREGQGALRGLGYAARAKLVGAVADVLVANRAKPLDNTDMDLYWRKEVTAEFAGYALREVRGDDMRETRLRIARAAIA